MFSERINKYIEPATIITIIISSIYLIGWSFSLSYFNRMNVFSYFLEVPTLLYLKMAYLPIVLIGGILYMSYALNFKNTIINTFIQNFIFLIAGLSSVYMGIYMHYYFIPIGLIIMVLYLYFSVKGYSIIDRFKNTQHGMISVFIYLVFVIIIFAQFAGNFTAEKHIGRNNIITFNWNGETPEEFEGKEFVLIINTNEKYYVTERQNPASNHPKVYIIPENQIEFAVIKKIADVD